VSLWFAIGGRRYPSTSCLMPYCSSFL
jgi:hypothetical protein